MKDSKILLNDLGRIGYRDAWELQESLRERRISNEVPDTLLILEHDPVFTLGKRDCSDDFLSPMSDVEKDGIEVVKCNRGGRVTYHGPGQIVGYFVCELASFGLGVKEFVHAIESMCMDVLSNYGIDALRDNEHPGLWVGPNKIVAIGLNISHGITQHGFAMNVDLDLAPYRHIVACGIRDRGVTSMERILGERNPSMDQVKQTVIRSFTGVFGKSVERVKA